MPCIVVLGAENSRMKIIEWDFCHVGRGAKALTSISELLVLATLSVCDVEGYPEEHWSSAIEDSDLY